LKRLAVVVCALGAGAIGAAVAHGQGGGGTVGPAATGTLSFSVQAKLTDRFRGTNLADPRRESTRPRIGDSGARHFSILIDGRRVGQVDHSEVVTYGGPRSREYRGGARFVFDEVYDFGSGNRIYSSCVVEDAPDVVNRCAVRGGTGTLAGARGTLDQPVGAPAGDQKRKTVTFGVTITFIP
jgi:hypothetical protein